MRGLGGNLLLTAGAVAYVWALTILLPYLQEYNLDGNPIPSTNICILLGCGSFLLLLGFVVKDKEGVWG